jgi:hypothetical protein
MKSTRRVTGHTVTTDDRGFHLVAPLPTGDVDRKKGGTMKSRVQSYYFCAAMWTLAAWVAAAKTDRLGALLAIGLGVYFYAAARREEKSGG